MPHRQARQSFELPNILSVRNFPAIYFYNARKWPARITQGKKILCRVPYTKAHGKALLFPFFSLFLPPFSFTTYFISNITHIASMDTFTHVRGPHGGFCWIPELRRSFSGGNTGLWAPAVYPLAFSARGSTNVLFHRFRFVQAIDTRKTNLEPCGTF